MDPKLQATYDKVMGTPTASQASATVNPPANPVAANPLPVIPTDTSQASPATPAYTQDNLNFQAAIQTPVVGGFGGTTPAPAAIVPPQHHTSSLLRILYIIGAIVFFLAYTFLWIKIFNLPLPF